MLRASTARVRPFVIVLMLAFLAPSGPVRAQSPLDLDQVPISPGEPRPEFRSGTTLIPIDVRVVDKAGQPVTDLQVSDFRVFEDNARQPIAQFAAQAFTPEAAAAVAGMRLPRAADAFDTTSPNRRTFLLLLGRGLVQEPAKGVDAMLQLVGERLLPQDYVAVMAWNRATDFTTDHAMILSVLQRFKDAHLGIEQRLRLIDRGLDARFGDDGLSAGLQARIDAVFGGSDADGVRTMDSARGSALTLDETLRRVGLGVLGPDRSLDAVEPTWSTRQGRWLDRWLEQKSIERDDYVSLYQAIEHMRPIAGQKQVIYLSEYGFRMDDLDAIEAIGRRASDARVAMNFIHAGGVVYTGMSAEDRTVQNTMSNFINIETSADARTITRLSGGQFYAHQFPTALGDVDRIDRNTRFQYTLAYSPTVDPVDGRYRRVRVEVTRPGLTVMARDGYYARAQVGPAETRGAIVYSRIVSAAQQIGPAPDLAIREVEVTPTPGQSNELTVSLTVDLSRVYFTKTEGLNVASLDLGGFALTSRYKNAGNGWTRLNLHYTDDELADRRRTGLTHTFAVPLTAKASEVKVVAYDFESDLLGSAVAKVRTK